MNHSPLDRYSFAEIDNRVRPFLQEGSLRKPDTDVQVLIDWVRKPSPGRMLSFIEVLSLARQYGMTPVEKGSIVPWAETALSMENNDDNVFRLEGRCPHCGAEHSLVRLFFHAPQCSSLREFHGYLYICDHCKEQLYLIQTSSVGHLDSSRMKSFGVRVSDLNLSVRAYNCLKAAGVETIGELSNWTREDLRRLRNCGSKCIADIEAALERHGLALKQN